MLVTPPDQAYGDSPPGDPIQPGDTLVFVVDMLGAHKAGETAKGEPAPTEDDSLPYVSITPKEPEIVMPAGDPVNRLIAIPVVVGDGPKVQKGQTIVVQYKGALWRTGKEFDSSWSRGQPICSVHRHWLGDSRLGQGTGRADRRKPSAAGGSAQGWLRQGRSGPHQGH